MFWAERPEHGGPGSHPAPLPTDDPGVLRQRGRPQTLRGHRDCCTCREGKCRTRANVRYILVSVVFQRFPPVFFFFFCEGGSGSEDHASHEDLQDPEAGSSFDRPQSIWVYAEAVLPAGVK